MLLPTVKERMNKRTLFILRIILGILIFLNMALIFQLSSQSAKKSSETSSVVAEQVAGTVIKDFDQKPKDEQNKIVTNMQVPLRNLAHFLEFATLGGLIYLLLLTWKGRRLLRYFAALLATALYALSDELHQKLADGRASQWEDFAIDMLGAFLSCSLILLICLMLQRKKRKKPYVITRYQIKSGGLGLRLAVASDLHSVAHESILEDLKNEKPDLILIPGDLTDDVEIRKEDDRSYDFLRGAASIAPTYYSLGNHELACYHKGNPWRHPIPRPLTDEIRERIAKTGAVLLENDCATFGRLTLCGLTSGINGKVNAPDQAALKRFAKADGYRILLCHHPEYFVPYVKETDVELTVCGHAHGGHWRFFGIAVYAPGQGLLPKYTSGVLENRCVISRGLGDHTRIPRIANRRELIFIDLI